MEWNIERWMAQGVHRTLSGHEIFTLRWPNAGVGDPVLFLHGFPTCSFDWRFVMLPLSERQLILLDMLGYGLSDKPLEHRYSLFEQADIVSDLMEQLGVERCVLVTHDVGDSVGGELCAREVDGTLPFEITARVVTNGSIYMDLVQLSPGQQLLLALPDAPMPPDAAITADIFKPGLANTFGPDTQPSAEELDAQWQLVARNEGNRILPRLIRYIDERRVHEGRWTGAIENHPSPLTIVWGDADPIAVYAMAERLAEARPDATLVRLEEIGHYPMIEASEAVAAAIATAIARTE